MLIYKEGYEGVKKLEEYQLKWPTTGGKNTLHVLSSVVVLAVTDSKLRIRG